MSNPKAAVTIDADLLGILTWCVMDTDHDQFGAQIRRHP